jgi:hypothetical protein
MTETDLQEVTNTVIKRAQRQGFVVAEDIREELAQTGIDATQWKEVVHLSGALLDYRHGRYYYSPAFSARVQAERQQQLAIGQTVHRLIRQYKKSHLLAERRQQGRADFIQAVKVRSEEQKELTVLSRDISATGIRLIGTRSLLGQKVTVTVPRGQGTEPASFVVRILWTCTIGDGLFENGGRFLEIAEPQPEPLKIVRN